MRRRDYNITTTPTYILGGHWLGLLNRTMRTLPTVQEYVLRSDGGNCPAGRSLRSSAFPLGYNTSTKVKAAYQF